MSVVLNARRICETALQNIGAFSVNDEAAAQEDMEVALTRFDLLMAEVAGVRSRRWLVQANKVVTLSVTPQTEYTLEGVLDLNGVQFPQLAILDLGNDNRQEIPIVDRNTFDAITNPTQTGDPSLVFIDRLPTPTMQVWPNPTVAGRTLTITFAEFAKDFDSTINAGGGNIGTELRPAWQRFMINQLAADLGAGPVRRLEIRERQYYSSEAELARLRLEAFEDRPHDTEDPISDGHWQ